MPAEPESVAEPDPLAEVAGLSAVTLRALSAAVLHRRMYPPEHPIASRALTSLSLYLERILSRVEEWRLALVGSKLMAGGRQIDEGTEGSVPFLEGLKARGIETISFKRGIEVEELRRLPWRSSRRRPAPCTRAAASAWRTPNRSCAWSPRRCTRTAHRS